MLSVAEPILGTEEKAALSDVVDSGWITMGNRVYAFERAFAERHDATDAVAVSSCTAALHLIMQALGIGAGDEVLVPSLTFVATINCVLHAGATPVFVDVEDADWPLISLMDAARKCTPKTRAVIVMHYAGYVADRDAWRDFADRRGLFLIEDAAHAPGAEGVGKFGHAAAFSFYGNKNMTTAEGGAVIAEDAAVLAKIRQLRSHGMTSGTFQRFATRTVGYDVTALGYNYRMDELRAALGLAQLKCLPDWNAKRCRLTGLYRALLADRCPNVCLPFASQRSSSLEGSSYHIMPIVLPEGTDRTAIIDHLRDAGIQVTIHYPAAHHLTFYRDLFPSVRLPRTEDYAERELTLPLHPRMEASHVERVAAALSKALSQ